MESQCLSKNIGIEDGKVNYFFGEVQRFAGPIRLIDKSAGLICPERHECRPILNKLKQTFMKKLIACLVIVMAAMGAAGFYAFDMMFSLDAKSKNSKDTSLTGAKASVVSKDIAIKDFQKIEASGPVAIVFSQGASDGKIHLEGRGIEMDYVIVESSNGKVEISFTEEYYRKHDHGEDRVPVNVTVSAPDLSDVYVSLSSSFTAGDIKTTGVLKLETSTSGTITIPSVVSRQVQMNASTSGVISVGSISCNNLSAGASTSGCLKFDKMTIESLKANASTSASIIGAGSCDNAKLISSTSGHLKMTDFIATSKVNANASTSGNITLAGQTQTINYSASTGGSIKASDMTAAKVTVNESLGGTVKCKSGN